MTATRGEVALTVEQKARAEEIGDAKGLEEALADAVHVAKLVVASRLGLAGGLKGCVGDVVGEQGILDECDGLDAGDLCEAVFDALVEGDVLRRGITG